MIDCSKDVISFHDDEVTLPQAERTAMRQRRDANRKRVKDGLKDAKKPQPTEFHRQGSYAMKTMVQDPDNLYDIDDGVYFEKGVLVGGKGAEMSALDARQTVRDAVDDGSFKRKPEALKNCVRIYYDAGYNVDIPVYRHQVKKNLFGADEDYYELASADWKRSDARNVTDWFEKENDKQSPDNDNGRQLRRICRFIKKFAQSRPSWRACMASGFMITKLVTECYKPNVNREDNALHDTMKAIHDRLKWDLVAKHPVTPQDTISNGNDDPKAKALRDRLADAIQWMEPLHKSSCKRTEALKCWDKVFNTEYFSNRDEKTDKKAASAAVLSSGIVRSLEGTAQNAVRKEGGGTYA
jgi:hypothetical protein